MCAIGWWRTFHQISYKIDWIRSAYSILIIVISRCWLHPSCNHMNKWMLIPSHPNENIYAEINRIYLSLLERARETKYGQFTTKSSAHNSCIRRREEAKIKTELINVINFECAIWLNAAQSSKSPVSHPKRGRKPIAFIITMIKRQSHAHTHCVAF